MVFKWLWWDWKPSIDWIVVLVINLATFWPFEASYKAIWLFFSFMKVIFYKPVTHPSPLYGRICDIDCAHFIDPKMADNSTSYPMKSSSTERL